MVGGHRATVAVCGPSRLDQPGCDYTPSAATARDSALSPTRALPSRSASGTCGRSNRSRAARAPVAACCRALCRPPDGRRLRGWSWRERRPEGNRPYPWSAAGVTPDRTATIRYSAQRQEAPDVPPVPHADHDAAAVRRAVRQILRTSQSTAASPRYSHGYCTVRTAPGAADRCARTAAYRRVEAAAKAREAEIAAAHEAQQAKDEMRAAVAKFDRAERLADPCRPLDVVLELLLVAAFIFAPAAWMPTK